MITRFILVSMLVFMMPFAKAADAPKTIDMTTVLLDENGKPLVDPVGLDIKSDPQCEHCPQLTLGRAIAHALFAQSQKDTVAPEQKWARAALAQRIRDDKSAALSAEEIIVVKRLMGDYYAPVVILRAFPLLDPNAVPPKVLP